MTDPKTPAAPPAGRSARIYDVVTRHWPRIAAVLVAVIGLTELLAGGLTASSRLEFYLTAWAATTGGIWFLFERAEKALSDETRKTLVGWLRARDLRGAFAAIPDQFAVLFDRVFGTRHLTRDCFNRSCVASYSAVLIIFALILSVGVWSGDPLSLRTGGILLLGGAFLWLLLVWSVIGIESKAGQSLAALLVLAVVMAPSVLSQLAERGVVRTGFLDDGLMGRADMLFAVFTISMLLNFAPDYLSLLETRWVIRWMERSRRIWLPLMVDLIATSVVSFGVLFAFYRLEAATGGEAPVGVFRFLGYLVAPPPQPLDPSDPRFPLPFFQISFLSAFFTSVWLWLYAGSLLASRLLLRAGRGIGFLLRVTDVENQPFRSIGFTAVVVTTLVFLLGLPLAVI